ncbi:hypothetical protein FHP05_09425 [Cerasibacillus terrae]|uniref:YesK-like protein n=1 Tax=Cerasibacillus terrae TaxID=2498845 RepID=A0A5C8NS52_9BACI|nr:hypothetical protein [Cerasibacillus terrae]TXL64526.1 hypothetical protein FHP05_09425 [Cerasibacillus terrae]
MLSNFLFTTIILFIVILSISLILKKRNSKLQHLIPITGAGIGLIFIAISLFLKSSDELGLTVYAFSLFISSAIAFMVSAMVDNMKQLKSHYRPK